MTPAELAALTVAAAFAGSFFGARVKLAGRWLGYAEQLAQERVDAALAECRRTCPYHTHREGGSP